MTPMTPRGTTSINKIDSAPSTSCPWPAAAPTIRSMMMYITAPIKGPDIVPIPPATTTNTITTAHEIENAELGVMMTTSMKYRPEASPVKAALTRNTTDLILLTSTPLDRAASSSSRTAVRAKPYGERIQRQIIAVDTVNRPSAT